MKVRLIFKDPNATVHARVVDGEALDPGECDDLVITATKPWVLWGEVVMIEIDTETGTARVMGANE